MSDDFKEIGDILTDILRELKKGNSNWIGKDHLSFNEAVSYLDIPPATLRGYTSKRVIPTYRKGKHVWYKKADLDNFILNEDNRRASKSEFESRAICQGLRGINKR